MSDKVIKIRVVPNASRNEVVKTEEGLKVYLTSPPQEGRANKALIEALADYFGLKKSRLRIIKGEKSRDKLIKIEE